jgi:threonine synthase
VRYLSTRGQAPPVSLSAAITAGIAPDGGLFVPERFPTLSLADFNGAADVAQVGRILLEPFARGDTLACHLPDICAEAFDFPAPLVRLDERTSVLELFHGPTAAFKDFGARFLAATLARLEAPREPGSEARPETRGDGLLTVLVATSGDTGGAVAAAFHRRPGVEVVVLFPRGRVSPRQEQQLTAWGDNVRALSVAGDFDDCQRLVKEAFADPDLARQRRLTSANSINLGRLLPQMAYYGLASLTHLRETGRAPGFIVPAGNLGNAVACLWAQRVGLPIRDVVLATNANATITEYFASGRWEPRATVHTLASAMDVGAPSNFERLERLFGGWDEARRRVRAWLVDDAAIRDVIRAGPARWGQVWDPHTATALATLQRLEPDDWIVVATAHPAKFEAIVEPLVGRHVPVPPALARLLERPGRSTPVQPTLAALHDALER